MRPMLASATPAAGRAGRGTAQRPTCRTGRSGCTRSSGTACASCSTSATAGPAHRPQRVQRHRGLPRAGRPRRASCPTPCSTARSWPWSTADPRSPRWPSGCTCRTGAGPQRLAADPAGRPDGLRRPAAVRRRACSTARSTSAGPRWNGWTCTGPHWQVPPAYDDGPALLAATREQGLEGVVSKRRASTYQPGRRSPDWVKLPNRRVAVLPGRRLAAGDRHRPADRRPAARRAARTGGRAALDYVGRVGSGISGQAAARAGRAARPAGPRRPRRSRPSCRGWTRQGSHWTEPQVVVDVALPGPHRGRPAARADLPRRCARDLGPHDVRWE